MWSLSCCMSSLPIRICSIGMLIIGDIVMIWHGLLRGLVRLRCIRMRWGVFCLSRHFIGRLLRIFRSISIRSWVICSSKRGILRSRWKIWRTPGMSISSEWRMKTPRRTNKSCRSWSRTITRCWGKSRRSHQWAWTSLSIRTSRSRLYTRLIYKPRMRCSSSIRNQEWSGRISGSRSWTASSSWVQGLTSDSSEIYSKVSIKQSLSKSTWSTSSIPIT